MSAQDIEKRLKNGEEFWAVDVDVLLGVIGILFKALEPFRSGTKPISWGKIKAHLPVELAKDITHFNYVADDAYVLAKEYLAIDHPTPDVCPRCGNQDLEHTCNEYSGEKK